MSKSNYFSNRAKRKTGMCLIIVLLLLVLPLGIFSLDSPAEEKGNEITIDTHNLPKLPPHNNNSK